MPPLMRRAWLAISLSDFSARSRCFPLSEKAASFSNASHASALPDGVATAAQLRARLAELNPDLADMLRAKTVRIAVNQELVADEAETAVSAGDEIALLPPLSGG